MTARDHPPRDHQAHSAGTYAWRMRIRAALGAAVLILSATGCGSGPSTAPATSPPGIGGTSGPVNRARDVVGDLNQQTRDTEQRSGGANP